MRGACVLACLGCVVAQKPNKNTQRATVYCDESLLLIEGCAPLPFHLSCYPPPLCLPFHLSPASLLLHPLHVKPSFLPFHLPPIFPTSSPWTTFTSAVLEHMACRRFAEILHDRNFVTNSHQACSNVGLALSWSHLSLLI